MVKIFTVYSNMQTDRKEKKTSEFLLLTLLRQAMPYILVCIFTSCKDTSNSVSSLNDIVFPASNISYEKLVQPLFNIGCATASMPDDAQDKTKS